MKCELFFRDLAKIPQDWRDSRAQQEGRVGAICLLAVGQRELVYAHSLSGNCECTEVQLADGTVISRTLTNGFGQTVEQAQPNILGGFICTRSEYNARGQLVKSFADTAPTAATLYEYDAMNTLVKQTLALSDTPTVSDSPMTETTQGVESLADGVYSITTTTRYNAAGQPITTVQKQLISQLSSTLESKSIHISERGLTSTTWSEYSEKAVKRVQYSSSPTSSITAETVTVDGFALSQKAIERRGAKSLGALKPATIEFW